VLKKSDGRAYGRTYVTLRGVLWGPDKVKEDDPGVELVVAFSRRRPDRYGHLSYSRTKFVVSEVLESEAVPSGVPSLGESRPRPNSAFPVLLKAALPMYPELARSAGIRGEVVAEDTVKAGRPAATTVKPGDRILSRAVLANIDTWRFKEDVEARFTTTFVFVLELRKTADDRNTRLELTLPSAARLIAAEEAW
jgi:hypothetical protein